MLAGFTLPSPPLPLFPCCYCCCCPFLQQTLATLATGQLATISFAIHSCPALRHARMQLRRDELLLKTFTGFISDFCCCCCCCCPGLLQDMPGLGRQSGIVIVAFICFIIYLYLFSGSLSLLLLLHLFTAYLFAHYTRHHVNRQWPCLSVSPPPLPTLPPLVVALVTK